MKLHRKLTACVLTAILGMALALPSAALASEKTQNENVTVKTAYAFATAPKQKNGAVFVVLENNGDEDLNIIKAVARVSEIVELHTHIMDGDVMRMREVDSFDLPAGETLTLKPHGDHIMLISLFTALQAGDSFPLTLHFDNKTHLKVDVSILKAGEMPVIEAGDTELPAQEAQEESVHDEHAMESDPEAAMDMEYHDMEAHGEEHHDMEDKEESDSVHSGE